MSDFRERLRKVGIGSQYLKLLRQPQGQIARMCESNDRQLFDTLYDIIGGRQALETWDERRRELNEEKQAHQKAKSQRALCVA